MKTINTIKNVCSVTSIIAGLALAVLPAKATTYAGSGNSLYSSVNDGEGISSFVINNTASTITFNINSSETQASYVFFSIELQVIGAPTGYTGFSNPYGPAIGISSGVNAEVNTDSGNTSADALTYSGGSWSDNATSVFSSGGAGSVSSTVTFALSSLGLSAGERFFFDVVSTYTSYSDGAPQSAYSALVGNGYPAEADGNYLPYEGVGTLGGTYYNGGNYYDSATDPTATAFGTSAYEYTITGVPEPATCALIGLGGLVMIGRMLRRNAV
jgi:hypothetical protein